MLTTTARPISRSRGVGLGPAPVAADAGAERTSTAAMVVGKTLRGIM
jgi:hypothetical protein